MFCGYCMSEPCDCKNKSLDIINHPKHYTSGGIECIDALVAATTGLEGIEAVDTANAIKYLWRWKYKNGVEDLKKAQWYINHLIGKIENEKIDSVKNIAFKMVSENQEELRILSPSKMMQGDDSDEKI